MSPVTTQRRRARRADGGRRPGTTRCPAPPATLFDAAPSEAVAHVDAHEPAGVTACEVDLIRSGEVDGEDRVAAGAGVHGEGRAAWSGETLDRMVVGGWERLTGCATTSCLLCGGTMEPTYGAHSRPIGGRCRDCGTTLS